MNHINSLSDLTNCEIIRHNKKAEIIIDTINPNDFPNNVQDWFKPVRLIGFSADANLTDFEIYEQGWDYLQRLRGEVEKNLKHGIS